MRIYAGNRGKNIVDIFLEWLRLLKQKNGILKANTFLKGTLAAKFQYKKYKKAIQAMICDESDIYRGTVSGPRYCASKYQ